MAERAIERCIRKIDNCRITLCRMAESMDIKDSIGTRRRLPRPEVSNPILHTGEVIQFKDQQPAVEKRCSSRHSNLPLMMANVQSKELPPTTHQKKIQPDGDRVHKSSSSSRQPPTELPATTYKNFRCDGERVHKSRSFSRQPPTIIVSTSEETSFSTCYDADNKYEKCPEELTFVEKKKKINDMFLQNK